MSKFSNYINDHRYSRQSYTIGTDVMFKLSEAKILLIGYNTLAQEIIKNLSLLGIGNIDIYFNNTLENFQKTGLYFKMDKNIPIIELQKLNPTISINQVNIMDEDKEIEMKIIKKYNVVIATNLIIDDCLSINKITHKLNIPFIMSGCYGLMSYIFNDFGETFNVLDLEGDQYESLLIEEIDGIKITFKDQHKLSDNDTLIVTWNNNDIDEIKVKQTQTPFIINLKDIPNQNKLEYKNIIKKKISQEFKFTTLKNNINNINCIQVDYSIPFSRSEILHQLHLAYNKYLEDYNESPRTWSIIDFEIYKKYLEEYNFDETKMILAKKFCYTLKGDLLPVCSIMAAIVSHEVIKALGHKYIPINQWLYIDFFDLIDDDEILNHFDNNASNFRCNSKYEGIINVFGKKLFEDIINTKPFIIGCGAIGCEIIKNLGMFGVKNIYITDPDHIEKSNLSRQFLFEDIDIREGKAKIAAKKIKLMNPDINIHVHQDKVCLDTENIFNDTFHEKIDIYLNALDNIDARLYMDQLAIKYNKPLIDSGTMGSKGNVQVVIPHLTESYGSSKDPDDNKNIPICTIKSFPYNTSHTIQWARELFETEFNLIPSLINKYKKSNLLSKLPEHDLKIFYNQIYKYYYLELTEEGFFRLLSIIYYENFEKNIKEIINKYSKSESKEELGDKKLPILLDINHIIINEFMEYGFCILNQMFNTNINYNFNNKNIIEFNGMTKHLETNILNKNIDETIDYDNLKKVYGKNFIEYLEHYLTIIPTIKVIDFEKDDDNLKHIHFINFCSNLRNEQYFIQKTDLFNTRKIAGNIIPALITTTSLITGYQILEYIKIIKLYYKDKYKLYNNKKEIDIYKNRYVNMDINYYDGINPNKVKKYKFDLEDISIWSNFTVNSKNTSDILEEIEKKTLKKIEFMTCGNKTIYDGDIININTIEEKNSNLLILFENVPIGVNVFIK